MNFLFDGISQMQHKSFNFICNLIGFITHFVIMFFQAIYAVYLNFDNACTDTVREGYNTIEINRELEHSHAIIIYYKFNLTLIY